MAYSAFVFTLEGSWNRPGALETLGGLFYSPPPPRAGISRPCSQGWNSGLSRTDGVQAFMFYDSVGGHKKKEGGVAGEHFCCRVHRGAHLLVTRVQGAGPGSRTSSRTKDPGPPHVNGQTCPGASPLLAMHQRARRGAAQAGTGTGGPVGASPAPPQEPQPTATSLEET